MNDAAMRINIGMHVEIKRSDGRIHGAVVSEIRGTDRYMVEWYEKTETKGKEVTLEELVRINPTLFRQPAALSSNASVLMQNNSTRMFNEDDDDFLLSALPPPKKPTAPSQRRTTTNSVAQQNAHVKPVAPLQPNNTILQQGPTTRSRSPIDERPSRVDAINGNGEGPRRVTPERATKRATTGRLPAKNPVAKSEKEVKGKDGESLNGVVHQPPPQPARVEKERKTLAAPATSMRHVASAPVVEQPKVALETVRPAEVPRRAIVQPTPMEVDPSNPHYAFSCMIQAYRAQIDYRPLSIADAVEENRISVCVRKRPLSKKELARGEIEVVTIPNKDHIILHQPQVKVDLTKYLENQKFRFDYTFDESTSNELVYRFTAQPLVKTIFEQGTATCFAYGQTGSGKTHTMGGDFTGKKQNSSLGIYALTARDIFKMVSGEYRRQRLTVHCSFFEIYGAKVYDLLANKAMLRVLEDGKAQVQVVGLKVVDVDSEQKVLDLINQGTAVRTAGTTSANANSSRSHAVFQIILRQGKNQWGKFSLIDLAGNERGQDTRDCDRETRLEGAEINKSLLALKECIRAMSKNNSHVPFRSSKLTLVLRDSFIGEKARTVMISMISPGACSCEHSLNTLRYANRVKELGAEEGAERDTPMDDADFMLPPEALEDNYDDDDEDIGAWVPQAEHFGKLLGDQAKEHRRLQTTMMDAARGGSREEAIEAADSAIKAVTAELAALQQLRASIQK